ncbi:MAG: VCBS repeat-containing protein [Candidatus Binatia bacterium]
MENSHFGWTGFRGAGHTVIGVFGGSDGIFEKQAEYLVGGPLRELLLADVNADGEVDVVGSNGMIVLHRTRGDGFDVPVALGGEVHGLAVGEIDGDACPDLVTTNGRTITSYRGRCDETFESHLHEIRDTNRSVLNGGGLLLGDVDGDGWNDVVAAGDQNDTISVLTNLGGGALSAPREYQGEMPWALAVGDFDEDGHPDLASDGGRILFGAADGSLRPGVPAVIPTGAGRVLSRDLDLDGHDDLAYGGWRLTAFYGLGDGTFQASANNPAGAHGDVAAGDVNVDGLLDLFIGDLSEVTGRVYVYLAQPGRRYAAATAYDTGGIGPTAVSAGDLTGDGVLDIVTANMGTNDFSVLVGRRDATFAPPQVFAAGTQPIAVALADVDPTELLMC